MSISVAESLFCLECEERHAFPSDLLFYQPPGKDGAPAYRDWDWGVVLTDRAWCFHCEAPVYLERVPSHREMEVASRFRSLDLPRPQNVEDELLELSEAQFEFLAKHVAGRRASGACITCGSTSLKPLQLAIDRVVNLSHPVCGGPLRLDRLLFNGVGPRTLRWFKVNGEQIEVQNDRL